MIIKKFKSKIIFILLFALLLSYFSGIITNVFAADTTNNITLSDNGIIVNGEEISRDSSNDVYWTKAMNNGGISSEAIKSNTQIDNVINISKAGTYVITGSLSNGQISIDSNNLDGDVIIILDNVSITCKNAPAIFIYNKDITSERNVIIKTAQGTTNTITGGKIKQSVEGWSDQDSILYYIEKDNDDDGSYYERYKYDGAISSDVSLIFEGEGFLTVESIAKEGIEGKQNITFNSGNYTINSLDDAINACTDHKSIITINGGTIFVNVSSEAEEGDGIDSNGSIYINGGKVYAFASEASSDNGLDSDEGIYINGGYVVATGNMADIVSAESKQTYMQLQFSDMANAEELITITDNNKDPVIALKSDRRYSILTISAPNLPSYDEAYIYTGGSIEGLNENGVYTQIASYTPGTEKTYTKIQEGMMRGTGGGFLDDNMNTNSKYSVYYYIIAGLIALLVIVIIIYVFLSKQDKQKQEK